MFNRNDNSLLSNLVFALNHTSDALKKGFTMMEMVLVMTVVVILFLLTVPNIATTLTVVNDKGCDAQRKVVDAATLQYMLKNDKEPSSAKQLISEGFLRQKQNFCNDGKEIKVVRGQAQ